MISEAREAHEDGKWCLFLRRASVVTQEGLHLLPEFAPSWGRQPSLPPALWRVGGRSLRHTVLLPFLFLLFLGPSGDKLREPACGSGAGTSGSPRSSAAHSSVWLKTAQVYSLRAWSLAVQTRFLLGRILCSCLFQFSEATCILEGSWPSSHHCDLLLLLSHPLHLQEGHPLPLSPKDPCDGPPG